MLNEDNYFYTNIFDEYYLNIDNVGLNGENYLIVGCIPGTKDIVSMYPIKYNPIKKVRSQIELNPKSWTVYNLTFLIRKNYQQ